MHLCSKCKKPIRDSVYTSDEQPNEALCPSCVGNGDYHLQRQIVRLRKLPPTRSQKRK